MASQRYAIVLHAGAAESWIGDAASRKATEAFLEDLISDCNEALSAGRSAVDVVADAVAALEDYPDFNAGKGAAVNDDGFHELEAGIMDGFTSNYRAAGCLREVKNPIRLAHTMLSSKSSPVFLVGQAGDELAKASGLAMVNNGYFTTAKRRDFWLSKKRQKVDEHGTVGAVALDLAGNLAAANSTGGMMFKKTGRMGDTAIVGAGLYADTEVAIACSGGGEAILQASLASKIAFERQSGKDLSNAIEAATTKATAMFPALSCGIIAVDCEGNISIHSNSRIFATASGGAYLPTWAGISRCSIPVIEPLVLLEDDLVRAGFAKHPTMPNQVIFKLKRPIDLRNADEFSLLGLLQRVRIVARHLIPEGDASACGVSMRDGQELMLFPLHYASKKAGVDAIRSHANSQPSKSRIDLGDGYYVMTNEGSPGQQAVNLFSTQLASRNLLTSDDRTTLRFAMALVALTRAAGSLIPGDLRSWKLTIDPLSESGILAAITWSRGNEAAGTYFPAPAPFNLQYPGYLSPELGPRLAYLDDMIDRAAVLAGPCAGELSRQARWATDRRSWQTIPQESALWRVGRYISQATQFGKIAQRLYSVSGEAYLPWRLGFERPPLERVVQ